jgi:hypothetical protein
LIAQAYNNTIAKRYSSGTVPAFSDSLFVSNMLTTISDWNQAKTGDIFVRKGHVFFFLSKNTGTSTVSIGMSESKTEMAQTARVGHIWVLEASTYNTKVGIRARPLPNSKEYILRRFKELL